MLCSPLRISKPFLGSEILVAACLLPYEIDAGLGDQATKEEINRAIENLKKAMEGEDTEEIKRLADELTQASHKLAETMYAKAAEQQAQAGTGGAESTAEASKDEDVVDADFEEVDK